MLIAGYIPCRTGSARLKNKNFEPFANAMSLTDIAIEHAMSSQAIDIALVDTDNVEYLSVLSSRSERKRLLGLKRPDRLATGNATTLETMRYMIQLFEKELEQTIDIFVLLQPTSPLRRWKTVDMAIETFCKEKRELIAAVTDSPININDTVKVDPVSQSVLACLDEEMNNTLFVTGAFYILTRQRLLYHNSPFYPSMKQHLFKTPFDEFIDIDYQYQYDLARQLFCSRVRNGI